MGIFFFFYDQPVVGTERGEVGMKFDLEVVRLVLFVRERNG